MNLGNTICACATLPGSGAIGVIRVSGPDALAITDKVVAFRKGDAVSAAGYSLKFGTVEGLDDVLVSIFRAPHSYTGEDSAEISCHASAYIMEQIVFRLISAGAHAAEPGEFTRRAFVNGKMDLSQAEAVADLIASGNESAHRLAMNQLRGGVSEQIAEMRERLLEVTALMELELDFSEEDVEFADRRNLTSLVDEVLGRIGALTESFRLGNAIRNGVPVAIVGAANTGKSTLLNALLGEERAIVSSVAGTTRDTVEETFNLDGILFRFIDTAGIRVSSDEIESKGIERTFSKLSTADIVIVVLDVTRPLEESAAELKNVISRVDLKVQDVVVVLNKVDCLGGFEGNLGVNKNVIDLNKIVSSIVDKAIVLPISAKRSLGLSELRSTLSELEKKRISAGASTTLLSNARHYDALCNAFRALSLVRSSLLSHTPTDLVAQDLREALYHLGTITGAITTDEVLGRIFEKFCIGK